MPQAHHLHYWLSGFAGAMALGWWWFHWQTSIAWILLALLALYDGHTLNESWIALKAHREYRQQKENEEIHVELEKAAAKMEEVMKEKEEERDEIRTRH
jgi:hypothetical protein